MIIETITVTTTPTTLYDLLIAAGRTDLANKTTGIKSVTLRVDESASEIVYAEDKDTVAKIKILDPANSQPYESHIDSSLSQTLLSASANVSVGVLIS